MSSTHRNRTLGFGSDSALRKIAADAQKAEVAKNKPVKRYKEVAQEDFIDVKF